MLKDITLGQYFPGDSVIHKLDPRTKLILVIVFIVTLFLAVDWISYAVMFCITALCIRVSRVRLKSILKGLKPLFFIILLTGILNLFYTKEGSVLLDWWIFTVTTGGIKRAFLMVVRIMLLVCGTLLLTYTTSPLALTDGLEMLLNPLKKIKVPVHEMSMMMSMALRFIPTLIEETDKIMSAQKARGADFSTGKLTERAKALLPLLVPLFVSSFRRADELAVAMESRCYHGGEGRTRMKTLKMARRDWLALLLWAVILAGMCRNTTSPSPGRWKKPSPGSAATRSGSRAADARTRASTRSITAPTSARRAASPSGGCRSRSIRACPTTSPSSAPSKCRRASTQY